jgi:hypothetical protein
MCLFIKYPFCDDSNNFAYTCVSLSPYVPSPWRMQVWNMYDNSEPEDVRGIKPFRIRMPSRWTNWFFCTFIDMSVMQCLLSDQICPNTPHDIVLYCGWVHSIFVHVTEVIFCWTAMHIGQHVPISLVFPNSWDIPFLFCLTVSQQLIVSGCKSSC